mgnify:CR=1 FL=1
MAAPFLSAIDAYSIDVGTTIKFTANNAYTEVKATKIFIEDVMGNAIGEHIYTNADPSITASQHVIPPKSGDGWTWVDADKYDDNSQLVMYIVTYIDSEATTILGTSSKIGFWLLPPATIRVSIDQHIVHTTSYTATAIYNSNNSRISNTVNEVQFGIYVRYDYKQYKENQLIELSPIMYTSGVFVGDGDYRLNYTFDNLVNGCEYYITVDAVTSRGMKCSDGYGRNRSVKPETSIVAMNLVEPINNACDGCIDVHSSISTIQGELTDGTAPIITPNGIDLSEKELVFSDGLAFSNSYNFSFWGNEFNYAENATIGSDEYILNMSGEYGTIKVYMVEDETHTYQKALLYVFPLGEDKGVGTYIESNEVAQPNASNDEFTCITIQYKNARYQIKLTNVTIEPEP